MAGASVSASMVCNCGCSGVMPALSIAASSEPVPHSSAILASTEPADRLPRASCSTNTCWMVSERLANTSKLPQLVRSDGTGLALSHFALTNPLRSWHAAMDGSRSPLPNATIGASSLDTSTVVGTACGAVSATLAASSEAPHADSATIMATASDSVRTCSTSLNSPMHDRACAVEKSRQPVGNRCRRPAHRTALVSSSVALHPATPDHCSGTAAP